MAQQLVYSLRPVGSRYSRVGDEDEPLNGDTPYEEEPDSRPVFHRPRRFLRRGNQTDWNTDLHVAFTWLHLIITLVCLVFSVWFVALSLGRECDGDTCKQLAYITTTFSSSKHVGSNVGWPVATQRAAMGEAVQYPLDRDTYAFSHYYECMYDARMADSTCGGKDTASDYTVCLKNNTQIRASLAACDTLSGSFSQPWATAEEYLQCIFRCPLMRNTDSVRASQNVFRACLSRSMWPFFEVQQSIDSPLFLGSFNWLIMIAVGFLCMTSFAVYTASPWELGKVRYGTPTYHMRLGLLWLIPSFIWILVFFVVYFIVAVRHGSDFESNGGVPTTTSTSQATLLILGACLFYFLGELLEACTPKEFLVHTFLSARAKWRREGRMNKEVHEVYRHGHIVYQSRNRRKAETGAIMPKGELGAIMPRAAEKVYGIDEKDVAAFYAPPLLSVWADGYLPDALIVLGMAGATGHLRTDQAWNLFFGVLFLRLNNMQISRYMYQCFMNNLAFSDGSDINQTYRATPGIGKMGLGLSEDMDDGSSEEPQNYREVLKPEDESSRNPEEGQGKPAPQEEVKATKQPHLKVQVMAFSAQIASIFLVAAICFICFNGDAPMSKVQPFYLFVAFGIVVPEAIRFLIHVACNFMHPEPNHVTWGLLNVHMFIWIWDLVVRLISICVVVLNLASPEGSRRFLVDKSSELLDTYLPLLSS